MPLENDDIEFDDLLAEKRHKELKGTLSNLATSLSKRDNSDIVTAIEKQTSSINGFTDAISNIKNPAPEVKVDVDLSAIKEMGSAIAENQVMLLETLKILVEQNKIKREWEFEFKRNYQHEIQSPIKARQIK